MSLKNPCWHTVTVNTWAGRELLKRETYRLLFYNYFWIPEQDSFMTNLLSAQKKKKKKQSTIAHNGAKIPSEGDNVLY